jgi:hypothetical protein
MGLMALKGLYTKPVKSLSQFVHLANVVINRSSGSKPV